VTPVAELDHVTKAYGTSRALDDVTLALHEGEILALLGPNGAGKTTAVALLLGLRRPDSGLARLFGRDPRQPAARRCIGATPQETAFPPTLRVRELLGFVAAHYAPPLPRDALVERFGLGALVHRQAGGLSGGERRRVAVALAFAGAPRAVFLDEPTTGFDLEARHALWQAVREHAGGGGSVLLTTHYLAEAQALAHRVVVLHGGRVVATGTPAELAHAVGLTRVRVRAPVPPGLAAVERASADGEETTLYTRDTDATLRALLAANVPLATVEVERASLEEAFRSLTGGDG
jgi:ABC-2 type transport system ATP-binding protein